MLTPRIPDTFHPRTLETAQDLEASLGSVAKPSQQNKTGAEDVDPWAEHLPSM